MGRKLLLAAILVALPPGAWAAPALPAVPSATTAAGANDGIKLEICRLPGSLSEYSGKAIVVAAGAVFTTDAFDDDIGATSDLLQDAPLKVVTTAPASISADKFCVDAPIKPLGGVGDSALHAALGRMFVASSAGVQQVDAGALDRIYGLLQQTGP
jgi:hypothetical protein